MSFTALAHGLAFARSATAISSHFKGFLAFSEENIIQSRNRAMKSVTLTPSIGIMK